MDKITIVFTGVVELKKIYPSFYSCFFYNISLWTHIFLGTSASHYIVITQFGHYVNWFQSLVLFLGLICICARNRQRLSQKTRVVLKTEMGLGKSSATSS